MSATLRITNFKQNNIIETAQIDTAPAVGATTVELDSNQNFAIGSYVIFGALGAEGAELRPLSSVNADGKNVSFSTALLYEHSRFSPVTKLYGNKIKVYRAPNVDGTPPADEDYTLVGSAVDIDIDQPYTQVQDNDGGADYWYKSTYYNSTTLDETSLADSKASRGATPNQYCSIDDVRKEAKIRNNPHISDADIDSARLAAEAEINSTLRGIYTLPFTSPINPLINRIASLLSAGFVLTSHRGRSGMTTVSDGQSRIDEARKLLNQLNIKELVLSDQNGADLSIPGSASGITGWPNERTATTNTLSGGGERAFRIEDRY